MPDPLTELFSIFLVESGVDLNQKKPMRTNSLAQFAKLHRKLTEERQTLQSRLQAINEALGDMPLPSLAATQGVGNQTAFKSTGRRRGGMSPAGRARIAAAQRARWAKLKGGNTTVAVSNGSGLKKKRQMSPAARKAIAAAARKRWAAAKAAGKSRL